MLTRVSFSWDVPRLKIAGPANRSALRTPVVQRQAVSTAPAKAPAAGTGTIRFIEDPSFKRANLSTETGLFAYAYVKNTASGAKLISWLQRKNVDIELHWVARPADMPGGEEAGGYTDPVAPGKFSIYVVAGSISSSFVDGLLTDTIVDAPPAYVARTLHHELLHAWFMTAFTDRPEERKTGHTAEVKPEVISETVTTFDPEDEYEPEFLRELKRFDVELRDVLKKPKIPGK